MTSAVDSSDRRRLLASLSVTRSVAIRWGVLSTAAFFGSGFLLGAVLEAVTGTALEPITVAASSPLELFVGIVLVIALLVVVIVPHELLHGVFMARYGAGPAYGVDLSGFALPSVYARSSGASYTRDQLLVILLAPFVLISAVGIWLLAVVQSPLLIVPIAANVAGSVGDLWMAAHLLRYPASVEVTGLPDEQGQGLGIYGTVGDHRVRRIPLERGFVSFLSGAAGTFTAVVVGLICGVILSLAFGSGDFVLGDPDGPWFLVRHELDPDGYAASFEFGETTLVVLSTLGGLGWAGWSALYGRLERSEP